MANYIISLDSGTHADATAAESAITGAGATITKTYAFGLTYGIDATPEQLSAITGVSESVDASAEENLTLMANRDHLSFLVDPRGVSTYNPAQTGTGKTVYLMDTGIDATHDEFTGATINNLYSNFTDEATISDYGDEVGHGTAVASLIVGQNQGSAPGCTLQNVKLFNTSTGTVTLGEIIDALDAVLSHHNSNSPSVAKVVCTPWVISQNSFVDNKILEMDSNNLLVVAAAGNNSSDVDGFSPAGVARVLTVGSFNRENEVTSFTNTPWMGGNASVGFVNFGNELDCFTLGVDVDCAQSGTGNVYYPMTGTSLSAGITAGAAACWMEKHSAYSSNQIKDVLLSEGHLSGAATLIFDEADANVDYSSVYKSYVFTEQVGYDQLTTKSSGRILNVQSGSTSNVDLGLHSGASNVSVLDFAPVPSWINVNTTSGVVTVNASGLDSNIVPGIFVFAMKGEVGSEILVEEFSVGVYNTSESELDPSANPASYYYDDDGNSYDPITNIGFQAATQKP